MLSLGHFWLYQAVIKTKMWPFRLEQVYGNQPCFPPRMNQMPLCHYISCGVWAFGAAGEFLWRSIGSTSQIPTRMCLCMCVRICDNRDGQGDDTNVAQVNDFTITYKFYEVRVWVILFALLFPVPWKVSVIEENCWMDECGSTGPFKLWMGQKTHENFWVFWHLATVMVNFMC